MANKTSREDFMKMFGSGGSEISQPIAPLAFQDGQGEWEKKRKYTFTFYPSMREKLKALTRVTKSKSDSTYLENLIEEEYRKQFGK